MTNLPQAFTTAFQEHQAGNLARAEQIYLQILQAEPRHADAHHLLGVLAFQQGRAEQALASIGYAVEINPHVASFHSNLGVVVQSLGRVDRALECFQRALQLQADLPDAHNAAGFLLLGKGKLQEALEHFEAALRSRPEFVDAMNNLGTVLFSQGKIDEAVGQFQRVMRLKPDSVQAHNNLGLASAARGRMEEAIAFYQKALQFDPNYVQAYNNLGNAFSELARLEEAATAYEQALRLKPDYAKALNNLGNVRKMQHRHAEALACYQQALSQDPSNAETRINRAYLWLVTGNWTAGWPELEWRWHNTELPAEIAVRPRWDGSPLQGRTILLHAEQGLGDTMQFVRFAPLVKDRGGKVIVQCQAPLAALLSGAKGIDQLVPQGTALPEFEVQAPLLSLPGILHTQLTNVPAETPYLQVNGDLVEEWRRELEGIPGFKVGIAWQGNPSYGADRQRSIPLARFAPLSRVAGVSCISLQKGPGAEQLLTAGSDFPIFDLAARLDRGNGRAFLDTAAVMQCLDLIITSDTAVAHLAGALGRPVWVALSLFPDWRWLWDREDSPWYPTMRLFRQKKAGDWQEVFERMAHELAALAAGKSVETIASPAAVAEAGNAESLNNQGVLLAQQGRRQEALTYFRRAVQARAHYADARNNLGLALSQQGQFEEAIAQYQEVLRVEPQSVQALSNQGLAMVGLAKFGEAMDCYNRALEIAPDDAKTHLNRAGLWLLQGDWKKGWPEYEWRLKTRDFPPLPFSQPRWDGSPLNGRTLLIVAEQGLGDTIQFLRFVPMLRQFHGKTMMFCQPQLERLLGRLPDVELVGGSKTNLPPFDCYCRLMSLPAILGTSIADIAGQQPYLQANAQLVEQWRQEFAAANGFKVGIAWQGKPTYFDDPMRSVPLQQFARLARTSGVRLISLQKGPGAEQVSALKGQFDLMDLSDRLDEKSGAFMDTAAIMKQLDLVICSDSAVAHIAGALGVPVWLALSRVPDWRWLMEREDCPWYPSMRLFRQERLGDWDEVFARMQTELHSLVKGEARPLTPLPGRGGEGRFLDEASKCHEAGDLVRAEELCQQLLQSNSQLPDAWCLLGAICQSKGDHSEAENCFRKALHLGPMHLDSLTRLGVMFARQGRWDDATPLLEAAVRLDPRDAEMLNNLGAVHAQRGDRGRAVELFRRAVQVRPEYSEAHANLGLALAGEGKWNDAIAAYGEALRLQPDNAAVMCQMGNALKSQGKWEEAVAHYQKAIGLNPKLAEAHRQLGNAFRERCDWQAAGDHLQQALALEPMDAVMHNDLGNVRRKQMDYEEAADHFREAIRIRPTYAEPHNNWGAMLRQLGQFDEAEAHFREALRLKPGYGEVYNNIGISCRDRANFAGALMAFDKALKLQPDHAETRWNRSLVRLLLGDFEQGWAEYDYRFAAGQRWRNLTRPVWDGSALQGKTILIWTEQGLGDALQFIRYAALVKQRGGRTLVECPSALLPLMRQVKGVDQWIARGETLPHFDVQVPLLSLPRIFKASAGHIPASTPYVEADRHLVETWRQRLKAWGESRFKIGIAWQGNAGFDGDRWRSIPLSCFAGVASLPNVQLISLQKGFGTEQLKDWKGSTPIVELGSRLDEDHGAFMDTAAVMKSLDLVISSDTALPHLAGALGVPVWVALSFVPDWRWLLRREDSPWYPSMHLFRQSRWGDWDSAFAKIVEALRKKL